MQHKLIGVLAAAMISACGGGGDSGPQQHSVSYVVAGAIGDASPVNITYRNASGGTSQIQAALPWTSPAFSATDGQFLYVSAQRGNTHGLITVYIYAGPRILKTTDSLGSNVIATASATCCQN